MARCAPTLRKSGTHAEADVVSLSAVSRGLAWALPASQPAQSAGIPVTCDVGSRAMSAQ